jgi:CPA2 family monovalent cation:H+ antiporter-2
METLLLAIFLTFTIATILNIVLKRWEVSPIIGYILTGTMISYLFGFNGLPGHVLEVIGEFGVVLLLFAIGLELGLEKIRKMREILLVNGLLQVMLSVLVIFLVAYHLFGLDASTALVAALAFALSSTAIVLTHLKRSKDILTPYGQRSMGILIFQDLAVIPILLLITFLSPQESVMAEVIVKTILAAVVVVALMFTIGKWIVTILLRHAAQTRLEELFLGAVFAVVIGASLMAHSVGFTFSLGAFIAGMLIADTDYRVKVESDIASYKDLLLGIFFFGVGTRIDLLFFFQNLHKIAAILLLVMLFKASVIYLIIQRTADKNTSAKTALALAQVGEFSFALFALAQSEGLLSAQHASFLILVSTLSMIATPFILSHIYTLSSYFEKEFYESDVITPIEREGHIVVTGFATLGMIVASELKRASVPFVIISDNLQHVLRARRLGHMAYFGHLYKEPVLESLQVDRAKAVIVTVTDEQEKQLIVEAVRSFTPHPQIVMRISHFDEHLDKKGIVNLTYVDASSAVAGMLIKRALK